MKQFNKLISILLCAALLILPINYYVNAATKVKINKKTTTIYVGKTVQLKVTGTKKKVTWSSSNKKIATVTNKGKVKGIKKGRATITAKVDKKKYNCNVTVKEKVVNKATSTPNTTQKPITTKIPETTSTVSPTATITPTATPNPVTLGALEALNIGQEYRDKNGLKVCVNSITYEKQKKGYKCVVDYSLENDTDRSIIEPRFRLFDVNGKVRIQGGTTFFYVFPKEKKHITGLFLEVGKPYILETDVNSDILVLNPPRTLNPDELHWLIPEQE